MAQTVLITLTVAGTDTGPFDLYSNVDGYLSAFEAGVSKASLLAGYTSVLVPDAATTIRVKSTSALCTNYVDLPISLTTTTTTSTSSTSTTTTTTTIPPDPGTANLTFTSYQSGNFFFDLSAAIPSTAVNITSATVNGSDLGACSPFNESDALVGTLTIPAGSTSGMGSGSSPMTCGTLSYRRFNSIVVNGSTKHNGDTIVIGGTTVTIVLSTACVNPYAC
jgi:hypothetical protein